MCVTFVFSLLEWAFEGWTFHYWSQNTNLWWFCRLCTLQGYGVFHREVATQYTTLCVCRMSVLRFCYDSTGKTKATATCARIVLVLTGSQIVYSPTHCLPGSLISHNRLPGKRWCRFSVLRKCSANSSALSNKIDLIACQGVLVFNSNSTSRGQ